MRNRGGLTSGRSQIQAQNARARKALKNYKAGNRSAGANGGS